MTVATWPDTLPHPRRKGYSEQYIDARRDKSGETGPPGVRLGWPGAARTVAMTLRLARAQKAVFERFFEDDIKLGSKPFWMPAPTSDGWPLLTPDGAPLLLPSGAPVLVSSTWLCLIGEVPTSVPAGVQFHVSFTVTVLP